MNSTSLPSIINAENAHSLSLQAEVGDLSHQEISPAPQKDSIIGLFDIFRMFKGESASQNEQLVLAYKRETSVAPENTSIPVLVDSSSTNIQADPSEITHQALSETPQDVITLENFQFGDSSLVVSATTQEYNDQKGIPAASSQQVEEDLTYQKLSSTIHENGMFNLYTTSKEIPTNTLDVETSDAMAQQTAVERKQTLLAQTDNDDISHQALATTLQYRDLFYSVAVSGSVPLHDETFRDFIDYGASVSFAAAKKLNENVSVTANIGIMLMTGDWSIDGDRDSIEVAAETWISGEASNPGNINHSDIIEAEDIPVSPNGDLGISYHSEAEGLITSSESLKTIDVHTDMYILPITINALYQFKSESKIKAYAGGGLGFCMATRDTNSKALKEKNFEGPEYRVKFNDTETVYGRVLQFIAGLSIPAYDKLTFYAEANTMLYDLSAFDPILEVSFKTPNPSWYAGSDLSTWSYEDPLRIGVFNEVFVTSFAVGFTVPF